MKFKTTVKPMVIICLVVSFASLTFAKHQPDYGYNVKSIDPTYESLNHFPGPLRSYSDRLIEKIVSPNRSEGQFILQTPVVGHELISRSIGKALDFANRFGNGKSVTEDAATAFYLRYGLHSDVTNSYYLDDPSSYAVYESSVTVLSKNYDSRNLKMGVTPNCFSCHSGRIGGSLIVGLGNQRIDYLNFFQDFLFDGGLNRGDPAIVRLRNVVLEIKGLKLGVGQTLLNLLPLFKEVFIDNFSLLQKLAHKYKVLKIDDLRRITHKIMPALKKLSLDLLTHPLSAANIITNFASNHEIRLHIARVMMVLDTLLFVLDPESQTMVAGTSDPWQIAVQLFNWRDDDMEYQNTLHGRGLTQQPVVMDPMPWWLLKYKKSINWDGVMSKSPRSIVQAAFSPGNSGEYIRRNELLFIQIYEAAHRMDSPIFPVEKHSVVESKRVVMVNQGQGLFNKNCAGCHGVHSVSTGSDTNTYYRSPEQFNFPNLVIAASKVGTDPNRANRVNLEYVQALAKSWIGYYGSEDAYIESIKRRGPKQEAREFGKDCDGELDSILSEGALVIAANRFSRNKIDTTMALVNSPNGYSHVAAYYNWREKCKSNVNGFKIIVGPYKKIKGYLAPPLWGISLSAPYLHNGSVPNLAEFLGLEERSTVWQKVPVNSVQVAYDYSKVGLAIVMNLPLPKNLSSNPQVYDTRRLGYSNKGHELYFEKSPGKAKFTADELNQILEYLKTL